MDFHRGPIGPEGDSIRTDTTRQDAVFGSIDDGLPHPTTMSETFFVLDAFCQAKISLSFDGRQVSVSRGSEAFLSGLFGSSMSGGTISTEDIISVTVSDSRLPGDAKHPHHSRPVNIQQRRGWLNLNRKFSLEEAAAAVLGSSTTAAKYWVNHPAAAVKTGLTATATATATAAAESEAEPAASNRPPAAVMEELNAPAVMEGDILTINYVLKNSTTKVWSQKALTVRSLDRGRVEQWRAAIASAVAERSSDRPKRLLFFINPYGGRCQAKSIFYKRVVPLLSMAGVHYEVIITERANHAKEHVQKCSLEKLDGLVSVGGDGMFSEVFNGLLLRCFQPPPGPGATGSHDGSSSGLVVSRPQLRVGIIPAGSTDAVVLSQHGTADVITATLHIILGDRRNVDAVSIESFPVQEEGLGVAPKLECFSLAMTSYGYFGDLLKRSEKLRWLGPKRYDVSGIKTFLDGKGYEASISFTTSTAEEGGEAPATDPTNLVDTCFHRCPTCESISRIDQRPPGHDQCDGPAINLSYESDGDIIEEDATAAAAIKKTNSSTITIEGRFSVIIAACSPCMSKHSPKGVSPAAHLGDGYLDLILVNETSRLNYFRYLFRTAYPTPRFSPFGLPFVKVYRVKEFQCQPKKVSLHKCAAADDPAVSVWNCDGEIIANPRIQAKVHRQILPVFARGIEKGNASQTC